jgi:hypothetical protein
MSVSNTTKRVKEIRRKTRCKFSSEEKIRIVLEGIRGECSIAELCRCGGQVGAICNHEYPKPKQEPPAYPKQLECRKQRVHVN